MRTSIPVLERKCCEVDGVSLLANSTLHDQYDELMSHRALEAMAVGKAIKMSGMRHTKQKHKD